MKKQPRGMPGKQASAVMASRKSAVDALDFFPTPPWGTRALLHHVLPHLGVESLGYIHEPCAGEGHMVDVLAEFPRAHVSASDIHDYGRGYDVYDYLSPFLSRDTWRPRPMWVITNPPFVHGLDIALEALKNALDGVALLLRTQWVESEQRYLSLFRYRPPTLIAFFTERLPMHQGRWEPDGVSATSYAWFVWMHDRQPLPPFWIPPGCRERLTRADDRARFAAWSLQETPAPLFDVASRTEETTAATGAEDANPDIDEDATNGRI